MKTKTPNSSSSSSVAKVKISNKKSKNKKIDRIKTSLKESSRDLSLIKFKSSAVVALVLFIVFGLLNSLFDGKVMAKLSFKPFGIVMKMSDRGLHGDDVTDCSMPFLFQGEGNDDVVPP
ncbi:calcium load-activated calcium channel homolog [Quercus lobata]|uniref:Transmembrane protein n=1 Tax=Quercus lobata TaxID=97700 RepID=A0A7N2L6Y8_QUELO|nr:calcium load-activated calcium channel homolog [Quercus lobata]